VTSVSVLLRGGRGEQIDARPGTFDGRTILPRSAAVVLTCRLAAQLVLLFGAYIALHAMTTPGGGFQGGVITASGLMLLYLGEGDRGWRQLVRLEWLDAYEGGGATLYALCSFSPMALGLPCCRFCESKVTQRPRLAPRAARGAGRCRSYAARELHRCSVRSTLLGRPPYGTHSEAVRRR
jgi:hypothetical protein